MFIKKVNKNGRIWIPKQIQERLNIIDGDSLCIYHDKNVIVVEKMENFNENNKLNQCVLNKGRVSIPAEIRRILKIKPDTPLIMDTSNSNKKIFLRRSNTMPQSKEVGIINNIKRD